MSIDCSAVATAAATAAEDEDTPPVDNIGEAATYSEKNDNRFASTENFFERPFAKEHAHVSDTETTFRKESKACSGGSAQEVESLNRKTCVRPSFANGASTTFTLQNSESDQEGKRNVNQECESDVKQLMDGTDGQGKGSKDVSRCKKFFQIWLCFAPFNFKRGQSLN